MKSVNILWKRILGKGKNGLWLNNGGYVIMEDSIQIPTPLMTVSKLRQKIRAYADTWKGRYQWLEQKMQSAPNVYTHTLMQLAARYAGIPDGTS